MTIITWWILYGHLWNVLEKSHSFSWFWFMFPLLDPKTKIKEGENGKEKSPKKAVHAKKILKSESQKHIVTDVASKGRLPPQEILDDSAGDHSTSLSLRIWSEARIKASGTHSRPCCLIPVTKIHRPLWIPRVTCSNLWFLRNYILIILRVDYFFIPLKKLELHFSPLLC